ncbi:MAG: glycerol-3-phosphate dehydrogenase [Acetobacteraceae bacterium]
MPQAGASRAGEGAPYDLAIIGGGINGCGIARDAAGRGWRVFLCEQGDLAQATSSASTKLIHGGLRYLEYYEFRLVREALREREVLWAIAPHLIRPLRFVLPHHAGLRPAWLLRLGLFLYDHLGGRRLLPPARTLRLPGSEEGAPLQRRYTRGFEYSDCAVDDSRLVVANARDAALHGAVIATRTRATGAERAGGLWRLDITDAAGGRGEVRARVLVNAAGPWVGAVQELVLHSDTPAPVRLVQGSHIVVPRLYAGEHCYIFQNADQRIVFAIPYEHDFTLIGTTDHEWHEDPGTVRASTEEIGYLCHALADYFTAPPNPSQVVWSYSGVRALYDDHARTAQAVTRDYVLTRDAPEGAPALLSVFGGKITTYRRLALSALALLAPHLPAAGGRPAGWTAKAPLPGGAVAIADIAGAQARLAEQLPFLDLRTRTRLWRAYGTGAFAAIGAPRSAAALGRDFGAGLYEAEVRYLVAEEWAATADDILWRRSKLGLRFDAEQVARLEAFVTALTSGQNAAA